MIRLALLNWRLWCWHKKLVCEGSSISVISVAKVITTRAEEIQSLNEMFVANTGIRVEKLFGLAPPSRPYFKLNINGARKQSGLSSAGSPIGDYNGSWIIGFGMNISVCLITIAELWGHSQGLV